MSKSLFFLLASVLLSITSLAQIKKGSVLLGGNFRVFNSKSESSGNLIKQNGFEISPVYGKAVKENLILGVEVSLGFADIENEPNNLDQANSSYGLGIFIRKYRPLGKSGFYIFLESKLAGIYSQYKQKGLGPRTDQFITNIGISIYPGISFEISKRLQIEAGFNNLVNLYYNINKTKLNGAILNKTTNMEVGSSLGNRSPLSVGFRFLFNRSAS